MKHQYAGIIELDEPIEQLSNKLKKARIVHTMDGGPRMYTLSFPDAGMRIRIIPGFSEITIHMGEIVHPDKDREINLTEW